MIRLLILLKVLEESSVGAANAGPDSGATPNQYNELIPVMKEMAIETKELRHNLKEMNRANQSWRKQTWAWRF